MTKITNKTLNLALGEIDPPEPMPVNTAFITNNGGTPLTVTRSMWVHNGSAASEMKIGGVDADAFYAGAGADTVYAGAGDDLIDGGTGNDLLYGEVGNDDLRGGTGNDSLYGGEGDDVLNGGADADTLVGGTGNDLYMVYGQMDTIVENAGEGIDTIYTNLKYVTAPANIERIVADPVNTLSGVGFTGNALGNTLVGSQFGDTLDGGAGADTMSGGAGNDQYRVDHLMDLVQEDGSAAGGIDTVTSSINFYTMPIGVENLYFNVAAGVNVTGNGNLWNNKIVGGTGNDLLVGAGGNDTLSGGGGKDTLQGGADDDVYMVDGDDVINEGWNGGYDTVYTGSAVYSLPQYVEEVQFNVSVNANGQISGALHFMGFGNAQNNKLIGNLGNDSFEGGDGNDLLSGQGGTDLLKGGTGNDTLDGGTGGDSMEGGIGDDTYYVDSASDAVIEQAAAGFDSVYTTLTGYTLPANVERVVFTGAGTFKGNGNGDANILVGGASADTLDGATGNDTMQGLGGDDYYHVDSAGDVIIEAVGGGHDTVDVFGASYLMPANVEDTFVFRAAGSKVTGNADANKMVGYNGADTLDGGSGDDVIAGLVGHDLIIGGAGNDQLQGGEGNDTIDGGTGYDHMWGGIGADRFVFHAGDGAGYVSEDRLMDFTQGADKMDFSAIDGNLSQAGDQQLAFAIQGSFVGGGVASVRYDWNGGNTCVHVDVNGDGFADQHIQIVGQELFLSLADFVL